MSSVPSLQEKLSNKKSLDEFKLNLENLIQDLETDPEIIEKLTEDEITEVRKYINPYGRTIGSENKSYTCLSYTNMTKEYLTKLLTTTMVGFVYRMCDEYEILDEELTTEIKDADFMEEVKNPDHSDQQFLKNKEEKYYTDIKYQYILDHNLNNTENVEKRDILKSVVLSEDDELAVSTLVKQEMDEFLKPSYVLNCVKKTEFIDKMILEQSKYEQTIIKRFLNKVFEYNPDLHTQSVYHENKSDIERHPLKPVSREEKDMTKDLTMEQVLHTKIPPNDTFLRFSYYYDVNFEQMQEVVKDIYCVKPDIDIMINVFDKFENLEETEHFVKKHKNEVITDILTLTNNSWNVIGPYQQNRERINFYNDNTAILESIFKQQEEDAKLGAELMKSRVKKKKVRNTRYMGKDDPKFKDYIKNNPSNVSAMGGIKVNEDEEEKYEIVEEYEIADTGALIDAEGIPEDSLKIGVTSVNAKTGAVSSTDIYTKAQDPKDGGSGFMITK
jgi:hypothetical protein